MKIAKGYVAVTESLPQKRRRFTTLSMIKRPWFLPIKHVALLADSVGAVLYPLKNIRKGKSFTKEQKTKVICLSILTGTGKQKKDREKKVNPKRNKTLQRTGN